MEEFKILVEEGLRILTNKVLSLKQPEKHTPAEVIHIFKEVYSAKRIIGGVKPSLLAVRVKINDLTGNMDVCRFKDIGPNDVERLRKYLKSYDTLYRN